MTIDTEQQTFGKVIFEKITQDASAPKCDRRNKDKSKCENRAVIAITNLRSNKTEYTCKTHARSFELEKVNLNPKSENTE